MRGIATGVCDENAKKLIRTKSYRQSQGLQTPRPGPEPYSNAVENQTERTAFVESAKKITKKGESEMDKQHTPTWVYLKSEPQLWTVGFYAPDGEWEAESDHESPDDAAKRVHFLNGEKE